MTFSRKWNEAGEECRSLHKDAHLLAINDAEEQKAVSEMLDSVNGQLLLLPIISHRFVLSGCRG